MYIEMICTSCELCIKTPVPPVNYMSITCSTTAVLATVDVAIFLSKCIWAYLTSGETEADMVVFKMNNPDIFT